MKKSHAIVCMFLLGALCRAQTLEEKIDTYVQTISARYAIPGAAVAVLQEGKVVHKKYYGTSNLASGAPITEKTLFKLHSLSKVFVATAIFQLIEEGKLSLEDPVGRYIDGLPKTWQQVRVKHLLAHSSGLPDAVRYEAPNEKMLKTKVFKGEIEFAPGDRFSYNQTNFWLLNRIITKMAQGSFEDFLKTGQFHGDPKALVFAQDKKAKDRATEYFANKEGAMEAKEFDVPEYMYGAAGIAITLDNFIQWNRDLDTDALLKPLTKAMMWSRFTYKNGHRFAHG